MGNLSQRFAKKIEKHLTLMQEVQALENALIEPRPPYSWKGQFLKWGEDMPQGFRATMFEEAEGAVLLGADGVPLKFLFVDANNNLRMGDLC